MKKLFYWIGVYKVIEWIIDFTRGLDLLDEEKFWVKVEKESIKKMKRGDRFWQAVENVIAAREES